MAMQKHPMETYHGIVRTPADAVKLFEACRLGLLPRVQRRLSEKERQAIRSGSVFVWDEREAGMRRWTDGKSWSASRVSGSFLTYREMEGKRGGGFTTLRRVSGKTPDSSGRGSDEDQDDVEPDGYRYKADGLMKQSFSITTSTSQHLHLISYYARPQQGQAELPQPTTDPTLRNVIPIKGMYPESSLTDSIPVPPVSRIPLQHHPSPSPRHHTYHQPPPSHSHSHSHYGHQGYPPYGQQGYSWPPSPMATPPYNHPYASASGPPQYAQQPPHPDHYSRTSPPPPPSSSYYPNQHAPPPPPPQQAAHPPYSGGYDRLPSSSRPPSMHSSTYGPPPSVAATAPASTLAGINTNKGYHQHQQQAVSPHSMYRQPPTTLPPISTATASAAPSYHTPQGSRSNFPASSQTLPPPLTATAPPSSSNTLTPPRRLSPSPTRLAYPHQQQQHPPTSSSSQQKPLPSYSEMAYENDVSPSSAMSSGNKASLSALLHPTPVSSEPNSAHSGNSNSASNSPCHLAVPVPSPGSAATSGTPGVSVSAAPVAGGTPSTFVTQHFLQPAPSGEDSRALSQLNRKFCI